MAYRRKKQIKKSSLGLFGLIIICFGIVLISKDYFLDKKEMAFIKMNVKLFESETPIVANADDYNEIIEENNPVDTPNDEEQPQPQIVQMHYDYIGILEIPKINLKQGFLDIDSKYNKVDYNITVIQTSTYPDVDKGNFILASHSGNSYISYFKNLYKLEKDDQAYIYYNGIKYTYKIVNIYNVEKTGQVAIYRDSNATCLTLITCTKNSDHEQTVYILELTDKQPY
ncbi:MAG: sortase [Bacilli bacterium]|nr:sortase [Bacilli bacterium]